MELTGNGSVDQILVNTYYVPEVIPHTKRTTFPTCSLSREGEGCAGRSVQHSVVHTGCVSGQRYTQHVQEGTGKVFCLR